MSEKESRSQINGDLPIEWSVHYGKLHPEKRFPVLLAAVVAGVLGLVLLKSIVASLLAIGVVVFSTAEIFLPWRYRLDSEQSEVRIGLSRTVLLWKDVKRAELRNGVLLLSPLQTASRMDVFRGVRLRFSGNQEQLLVTISELIKNYGCVLDRGIDAGGEGQTDGKDD